MQNNLYLIAKNKRRIGFIKAHEVNLKTTKITDLRLLLILSTVEQIKIKTY